MPGYFTSEREHFIEGQNIQDYKLKKLEDRLHRLETTLYSVISITKTVFQIFTVVVVYFCYKRMFITFSEKYIH